MILWFQIFAVTNIKFPSLVPLSITGIGGGGNWEQTHVWKKELHLSLQTEKCTNRKLQAFQLSIQYGNKKGPDSVIYDNSTVALKFEIPWEE